MRRKIPGLWYDQPVEIKIKIMKRYVRLSHTILVAGLLWTEVAGAAFEYQLRIPLNAHVVAPAPAYAIDLLEYTLPGAMVGKPYSFDFKSANTLSLSGTGAPLPTALTWSMITGALPDGLALNPATGVVSGTPTTINETGANFEIVASREAVSGQGAYSIIVAGLALQVSQIASGWTYSCAVTTSGGVKCWGANDSGQLGNGGFSYQSIPGDVTGLTSGVAEIVTGNAHSCAITTSGGVKCWGDDRYGQLGDGGANASKTTPVDVIGLSSGVAKIAAGHFHTCAIMTSGAAKCWGYDGYGELGDGGANASQTVPSDVVGLTSGVTMISAGINHTCAVHEGAAKCWGYDNYGRLGDGGVNADKNVPTVVSGLASGVSGISVGAEHSCAVTTSGGAKCWGYNFHSQLGDGGPNTDKNVPGDVAGLTSGVIAVAAGAYHTCAITTSGGAKCWGSSNNGRLGDGVSTTNQNIAVNVVGLSSGVTEIAAGGYHTCAVTAGGGAKCWGWDAQGQLGDNATKAEKNVPVAVLSE